MRLLSIWLGACCAIIILMVFVGGITRLTNSGLSITEWRPITGIIPPVSDEDWIKEMKKYEKTPEYIHINRGMLLKDFKRIYMTEYMHRLLGRVLGMVFFLPMIFFVIKGAIGRTMAVRLSAVGVLGLIQGLMGWMMVKSGLVDVPFVSHFRLAAHLFITIILFSLVWYSFLESVGIRHVHAVKKYAYVFFAFTVLVTGLQMILGALVAGLDAGLLFNTFPLIDGAIVPKQILSGELLNERFLYDGMVVQFLHRIVAMIVLVCATILPIFMRMKAVGLLFACVVIQFLLGVTTLLHGVPVSLASMHQIQSFIIVAVEVYVVKTVKIKRF